MKYNLLGAVSTIALGAAFGIGAPGAANAVLSCSGGSTTVNGTGYTCTETVVVGFTKTNLSNTVLTLDLFNLVAQVGSHETLTAVSYKVSGQGSSTGFMHNNATAAALGSVWISANSFSFTAGAGAPSDFLSGGQTIVGLTGSQNAANAAGTGKVSVAAGGNLSFTDLGSGSGVQTAGSPVSGYIGAGTFQALASTSVATSTFSQAGNVTFNQTTQASPTVSITYTFNNVANTVPEPASMALLGAGLAGLGVVRRRRAKA